MQTIKQYIQDFISRAGSYVFFATIFSRLLSFSASWIALQFIDNQKLGVVLYAFNIITFMLPIAGLGLHQSLLRYGALTKTDEEKNSLFNYTFKKGLLTSLGLILVVILGSLLINFSIENPRYFIIFLSFSIIPHYILELLKIKFRLQHNNKTFALIEFAYTLSLVILVTILAYYFKEYGYAIALVVTPIITCLPFVKHFFVKNASNPKVDLEFWKYGFFASLSNVASQLLFVIDIILIGNILKNAEMVTNYKYVSLIPFSILFLPRVFIATDFVAFTEKIKDVVFIKKYVRGYTNTFLLVSAILLIVSFLFAENILSLFDKNFTEYTSTFIILCIGVCGILIFRGLYGNLLSSIGKAHINYYAATIALILNVASNYYLIPKYGIKGAAITSSVLMWFTGILSLVLFWYYYKKLK